VDDTTIKKQEIINKSFEFIKNFEWCHLVAYRDYKHYSIWYGLNSFAWEVITQEEAERRAKQKIEWIIDKYDFLKYNNEWLIIALTSFTYNLWYPPSGYDRFIRNNYYEWLKNRIKEYNRAGWNVLKWLVKRRQAEADLF